MASMIVSVILKFLLLITIQDRGCAYRPPNFGRKQNLSIRNFGVFYDEQQPQNKLLQLPQKQLDNQDFAYRTKQQPKIQLQFQTQPTRLMNGQLPLQQNQQQHPIGYRFSLPRNQRRISKKRRRFMSVQLPLQQLDDVGYFYRTPQTEQLPKSQPKIRLQPNNYGRLMNAPLPLQKKQQQLDDQGYNYRTPQTGQPPKGQPQIRLRPNNYRRLMNAPLPVQQTQQQLNDVGYFYRTPQTG